MNRLLKSCILLLAFAAPSAFAADNYPNKTVRWIIPFPPGGGVDVLARIIGEKLTEIWGQNVLIENRSGAQGNIGTAYGAKAAPDGYTLVFAHQGALVINPHLYKNPGYNTLRDFAPVSCGTEMGFILVVHPSLPVRTMKELALLAKRSPGQLTFGSSSSGPWMVGELFKLTTGTDILHVPYKGGPPAVADLLGGHIAIMFSNPTVAVPHAQSGKVRALAVMTDKRNEALPNVPTAREAGYPELSGLVDWYGVAVPAATPRDTINKINAAVVRALKSPDVIKRVRDAGQTPAPCTPDEFAALIKTEFERWGKIVKASGAKVE